MRLSDVKFMRGMPFASVVRDQRALPTFQCWQLPNRVGQPPIMTMLTSGEKSVDALKLHLFRRHVP